MDSITNQLSPDEIEDQVLEEILKLQTAGLEAACAVVVGLDVPDAAKGNRKALRKLLINYLMDSNEIDNKTTDFLLLNDHLFPVVKKKDGDDEVFEMQGLEKHLPMSKWNNDSSRGEHKPLNRRRSATIDTVDLTRVRFKEFKPRNDRRIRRKRIILLKFTV